MIEMADSKATAAVAAIAGYPADHRVAPNMRDYGAFRSEFSWTRARCDLDGLPGGGLNIAHEAVDRHAAGARKDHIALRWLGKGGATQDFSFASLSALSSRFANVLRELGVGAGERVYVLTGRIPELYIAALGAWKNRSVVCTLFSAFGPEPLRARMALGDARVLVTTPGLYARKIVPILNLLPGLRHVLLAGEPNEDVEVVGTLDFAHLLSEAAERFDIAPTDPEDPALLHFTSGTTGTPKGAVHVHQAVVTHYATGKSVLDLHPEDVFWCTADLVALEVVKAFVALKTGYAPSDALKKDIVAHARKRLGTEVAPKEIDFQQSLPKTRSGKIMRRLLKARELSLPEGDVSTLESMWLDIDSMDFLNFLIALHEEFGVDVPEADAPKLGTIDACVSYLEQALRQRTQT